MVSGLRQECGSRALKPMTRKVICVIVGSAVIGLYAAPGGPSAARAADRAHELVSPANKSGGEIMPSSPKTQSSADGAAVTFTSLAAFGDVDGTGVATDYVAKRGENGWTQHGITPPQEALSFPGNALGLEPHYVGGFSADLAKGVVRAWSPLTDAPDVAEAVNLYVRDDVLTPGGGSYALVTMCPVCVSPLTAFARASRPTFAGASSDFEHVIFESTLVLAAGASGSGPKLYERVQGTLRLAGILPNGSAAVRSIAGRGVSLGGLLRATSRPISADGSRIVFTVGTSNNSPSGGLYMRIDGATTIPLNRTERAVPEAAQPATYWDASADHSRVFFTSAEALTDDAPATGETSLYMWRRQATDEVQSLTVSATGGTYTLGIGGATTAPIAFDAPATSVEAALEALPTVGAENVSVSGGPGSAAGDAPYAIAFGGDLAGVNVAEAQSDAALLTGGASTAVVTTTAPVTNLTYLNVDEEPADTPNSVQGVFGTGEDGRHVYFAASGQLVAGKPGLGIEVGLYAWHDGTITYIGKSRSFPADADDLVDGRVLSLGQKQSDVTPDGRHLVLGLGDGDGLLSAHGGADYDHGACRAGLSACRELYVYSADSDSLACASCNPSGAAATVDASARTWEASGGSVISGYSSRVISDDGHYVFFSTREALVAEDTNNRMDAYVYDVRADAPQLLSSGSHSSDSYFLEASPNGEDAFFVTRERLVGWDGDEAYDLYDARVGGGFPEPVATQPSCAGDGCQGPPSLAPPVLGVGSATVQGSGDLAGRIARPTGGRPGKTCKRGTVRRRARGRARCVARTCRNARSGRGARSTRKCASGSCRARAGKRAHGQGRCVRRQHRGSAANRGKRVASKRRAK